MVDTDGRAFDLCYIYQIYLWRWTTTNSSTGCNTVPHTATHCNRSVSLHRTATHRNTLQQIYPWGWTTRNSSTDSSLALNARLVKFLQVTSIAIWHDRLKSELTFEKFYQWICMAISWRVLRRNSSSSCRMSSLKHRLAWGLRANCVTRKSLQHTATECNVLQLAATLCNALPHICVCVLFHWGADRHESCWRFISTYAYICACVCVYTHIYMYILLKRRSEWVLRWNCFIRQSCVSDNIRTCTCECVCVWQCYDSYVSCMYIHTCGCMHMVCMCDVYLQYQYI